MILDILAGFFSGIIGAMGLGGGGILILYLTLIKDLPQLNAQGINLIFFIPTAIVALLMHTKNKLIEWKTAFKLILAGLIGIIPGYYLINILNESILRKLFAAVMILVGIINLLRKDKK